MLGGWWGAGGTGRGDSRWDWGTFYHSLKHLRHLPHRELDGQPNGLFLLPILLVLVLVFDLLEQLFGFFLVRPVPQTGIAGELTVFVDDAQADDFVAVLDEFLDEPFDGVVRVVVVVRAAEEGPGALGVSVVFVFGGDGEGVVGCVAVVEGVEGDAAFVLARGQLVLSL